MILTFHVSPVARGPLLGRVHGLYDIVLILYSRKI